MDPRPTSPLRMLTDANLEKVEQLIKIAEELGVTYQLSLAWILHQPGISSALIGASKPSQVEENVKAIDIELSSEVLERIENIMQG